MAAIVTAQAGDWDDVNTWVGGVVPGDGDTVTLNHAVTVNTAEECGTHPTDQTTIVLAINANLTIDRAAGGDLQVYGNVHLISAHFIGSGGGTGFRMGSATASSQEYLFKQGDSHGDVNEIQLTGASAANKFILDKVTGGANWYFEDVWQGSSNMVWTDVICRNVGTASNHAFDPYLASGDRCHLIRVQFEDCGEIWCSPQINANSDLRVEDSNWSDSLGTYCLSIQSGNALTGANRTCLRNSFDKTLRLITPQDLDWDGNYVNDVLMTECSGSSAQCASAQDNMFRITDQPATPIYTDLDRFLWLLDYATANKHGISHSSPNSGRTYRVENGVFEADGTDTTGDMILAASTPAGAWTLIVAGNIVLPNPNGGAQPGTLLSCLGSADLTFQYEHNTVICSVTGVGGLVVGETYAGHSDMGSRFRSNLHYHTSANGGYLVHRLSGAVVDLVDPAFCDYNAKHNLSAGSEGGAYNTDLTGAYDTDYGTNDIDADPEFVEAGAALAEWDASLGGPGTRANALSELANMNGTGWDSNYTPTAAIAWIRGRYAPTNVLYDGAGHDGVAPGAMDYAPAGPGFSTLRIRWG